MIVKYRATECGRSQTAMIRALVFVMIHESYSSFDTWNGSTKGKRNQSIIQVFGKAAGGGEEGQRSRTFKSVRRIVFIYS